MDNHISKHHLGEEPPLIAKQNVRQSPPSQSQAAIVKAKRKNIAICLASRPADAKFVGILNSPSLWRIGTADRTVRLYDETFTMIMIVKSSWRNTKQAHRAQHGDAEAGNRASPICHDDGLIDSAR